MLEAVRKSLSAKISIAVTGMLIVFISVLTLVEIRSETRGVLNTYKRNGGVLASTIEKGLISAMNEGRSLDVQKSLEDVGTQEDIIYARIFDENGNVLRSSQKGEIGGTVDKETFGLFKGAEGPQTAVSEEGTPTFSFVKPIYNGSQCFECHPQSKKINGVLNVKVSLGRAYEEIRENHLLMLKWGFLTILCIALSEIWLIRFLVGEPVKKLRDAMVKAEKGEEFALQMRYRDELGELAQVFRGMMGRITEMGAEAIEREKELVRRQDSLTAQSKMASVIDGMPDGVVILDRDMRLALTNPKYREMFPDAKIGEPCYACVHRRDQVCPHCGVVKVFDDGKVHEHQSNVAMPDGSFRAVHSISAPIRGENGAVVSAVEVIRDITDRVAMEKDLKEKSWELERANKRLARMAVTDGLTMLFNHRFFQDSLRKEFKRLERHRALPFLSLAMIDIDNFKTLNDNYGHQAGDRVLRGISKVLKDSVRLTDLVARYGGEEFVIIMPETDTEGTGVVAERIRRNIENAVFAYKDLSLRVTVSVGLASYPQEDVRNEDELIKAADSALYEAKRQGRNRVVIKRG